MPPLEKTQTVTAVPQMSKRPMAATNSQTTRPSLPQRLPAVTLKTPQMRTKQQMTSARVYVIPQPDCRSTT